MPANFDPWKQKLPPKNPHPARRLPADEPNRGLDAGDEAFATEGYRVLDRANPRNPFGPSRPGLSGPPVYDFDVYPDGY